MLAARDPFVKLLSFSKNNGYRTFNGLEFADIGCRIGAQKWLF
jgi:hypothetical protein